MTKIELKRKVSAWILLSVFIPMLIASSLHIHGEETSSLTICHECINHIPHSGHLFADQMGVHSCILCQFLSIVFLAASAITISIIFSFLFERNSFIPPFCQSFQGDNTSGRAPPFLFCIR